jgi:hypothetical protein
MTKTIISILAIGHSGSHYLSLLLGSHSRAMHLGEVHYLGKADPSKQKKVCTLCGDNRRCPVFGDIDPRHPDRAYETIAARVDPGVTALIDISKDLRWIDRFVGHPTFTMKYIHLIRDPRAFLRLWSSTYTTPWRQWRTRLRVVRERPGALSSGLWGTLTDVYLYDWVIRNREITRFIRRRNLDAYVATYHDVATDPVGELKRVMDWIGLDYEPGQLEYWNVEHHGTQKGSYEWVKREKVPHVDLRWQTDLPREMIARVPEHPAIAPYVKEMGLAFTDTGLTRVR